MWRGGNDDDQAKESTPLLPDQSANAQKNWAKLRNATNAGIAFRRTTHGRRSIHTGRRMSVRGSGAFPFFAKEDKDDEQQKPVLEPMEALTPLVAGGKIVGVDGTVAEPHPPPTIKSIPAYPPYCRKDRHRSFYLWWLNEFRHWWKSSRLVVRLGGLDTHARDPIVWAKMVSINPLRYKSLKKMKKLVKRLGQGGPMRYFLKRCHPFTRTLRITVGAWRWVESAQCRRLEVGVEETMAFIGNRVSRMIARLVVDSFVAMGIIPSSHYLFKRVHLSIEWWFPAVICIIMGIIRATSPYGASFQGSRVGRVLTRSFFRNANHRWLPIQHVQDLNLDCDDCQERDEVSENADLAKLAKKVAKALGQAQSLGLDGMEGQNEALGQEGFKQVGAGSGGYAVYECHRVVRAPGGPHDGDLQTILLHVTPYGPSLLDVMPRYIVLEKEDSQDRRSAWSETIASHRWTGPSVVEGYAYQGAFFSAHHFASMQTTYDKQLVAYDRACKALSNKKGREVGPPTDLPTLKQFLNTGKLRRKQKKNNREYRALQKDVHKVTKKLENMMGDGKKKDCTAPWGVILYFEGLDCSGKSSTGGLVQQALDDAGYNVEMRQYNRPPTEEQKRQPWMNRFELPDTSPMSDGGESGGADGENQAAGNCSGHRHTCMVWDRGPAGDFVYGALAKAPESEKCDRYREFMAFDQECFKKNILFIKLMFVTNRDSIASTLGKRLAQRKMVQDLRTWLKASYGDEKANEDIPMEGLDFIDMHIDPTDFVAFNQYQSNLRTFTNFALNTDSSSNPWVVVNTTDRFTVRKQLLQVFRAQLDAYAMAKKHEVAIKSWCMGLPCPAICPSSSAEPEEPETPGIAVSEMVDWKIKKGLSLPTIVTLMGLLILVFYYCEHTTFGENTRNVWRLINPEDYSEQEYPGGD